MQEQTSILNVKNDFPIFQENKDLVYLDSAATSQKPEIVIKAIENYYKTCNANIHRGVYKLSEIATEKYNEAREVVSKFINSEKNEIIFTKGTTESINFLVYTIDSLLFDKEKKEIVLTELEHHSNLVPWQQFAKHSGFKLKFIKVKDNFELDLDHAKSIINENTAIVSLTYVSNSLGTVNPVKEIVEIAKKNNAISIVDAAQAAGHKKIDVRDLDCDFLAFSGHKMFGPMGIGVLYGKKEKLEKLRPFHYGGDMISKVSYEESTWNTVPERFEAGTQNVAGAIGLMEAIKYINKIGIDNIEKHEEELREYALSKLKEIKEIQIYAPEKGVGIVSFNLDQHAHDIATFLDQDEIAIRGGHHCNMPLMKKLGLNSTARISFSVYNTKEDIDKVAESLKNIGEGMDDSLYREHLFDLYKNPLNFGILNNATNVCYKHNPLCGDEVTISLIIEDNKVKEVRFKGQGCAISMASASLVTEKMKGMNIDGVRDLNKDDVLKLLEIPISSVRLKCALLSLDAVKGAIENE